MAGFAADPQVELPPIQYAWLKKFEGDDMFKATIVNQSGLPFAWDKVEVERVATAGLFHQQHYSNFYHMFSEVAPTMHHVVCKWLGDCTYDAHSSLRLFFVQEKQAGQPAYIMLDSLADVFKCLSPAPVLHKDDAPLSGRVVILEKAVVGVSPEVRVFHNWEKDLKENWKEPPRAAMQVYRQRIADCFGFPFDQRSAADRPLHVLFINRHYEEGRTVLNAAKLAHQIRSMSEFRAFPGARLDIAYLESEQSIREQAALFWNASLLIWPHGATMSHTFFLPQGAQAIEVVPWVQQDKANLPEWVQAIRDAFGLRIKLYDIQNRERPRSMFNQDKLLEYEEYRRLTSDQKIALLERGECPAGVDAFLCPFWWNHWKVSVNFDWAALEPVVRQALQRLKAGWNEEPAPSKPKTLRRRAAPPPSRSPSTHPARALAQVESGAGAGGTAPAVYDWTTHGPAATARDEATGVPLSSFTCVYDDGAAARRYCVFRNLVTHGGVIYYISQNPASTTLPDIQIAWEEWNLEAGLREDKFFVPAVVAPAQLPKEAAEALRSPEVVPRAVLAHAVDSGNFYHLLTEVAATNFANQCGVLGLCDAASRAGLQLLFIQPDPRRRFAMPHAPRGGFECLGGGSFRYMRFPPVSSQALVIKHGVVGIGPYMRAYERQEYFAGFKDPPPGWSKLLGECTGTGFHTTPAPLAPLRVVFVNRPWSQGRSLLNLPETLDWLRGEWAPSRSFGAPLAFEAVSVSAATELRDQIAVFQRASVLVYPHGATMAHAQFLPRNAAVLEVIPWKNVTEPHGWLLSIKRQMQLDTLEVGLMVNDDRANLVLNWHVSGRVSVARAVVALSKDPVWRALPAEQKVDLQENGECPPDHKPECFFDWLHWRSNLVLDRDRLASSLEPLIRGVLARGKATQAAATR
ncbi:hypothetical protein APUTEX25_000820 [Auxenochlorella protothecoides]|uniref:Glycosyltransferase 61 catalytic domain-containing protein n=1 Tax=Auxenochlorella protothecoides TaxID=3075 RepID=A0A3M7KQ86_AUXPR|nr:hypothetical protein APUTEX25_000820 [Auxenochlorella protothecoides]|eukprot:RMZ52701.1 hypothetical protein APUTEX25_000820 [Auxenochlorella protothecoides]